jgi:hypothetical protein
MSIIVRRFSLSEHHETLTKMNVSVAFKLTIARFLNSCVILVATNTEPKDWFKGGNLAFDASILMIMMAFQTPILLISDYQGIIKRWYVSKEEEKGDECTLTQREANIMCEGPLVDIADEISYFMVFVMTCIFYSPILPVAIPIALFGSIMFYWSNKYQLLR